MKANAGTLCAGVLFAHPAVPDRALGFAPSRFASRPLGDDPLRGMAPLAGGSRSRVPPAAALC
jgi:hypothetical protein